MVLPARRSRQAGRPDQRERRPGAVPLRPAGPSGGRDRLRRSSPTLSLQRR
ncbi:hypothetical protein AAAC14_15190 [Pseudomonas aeruginosa]